MSASQNRDSRKRIPDTEHPYAERLTRAQMIALTRQARLSNIVPPINSIILGILLWGNVPTTALIGWLVLTILRYDRVYSMDWVLKNGRYCSHNPLG